VCLESNASAKYATWGQCFTTLCDVRHSTINVARGPCGGLAGHCSRDSQGGTGLELLAEVLQHVHVIQ